MKTYQALGIIFLAALVAGCGRSPLKEYVVEDGSWAILLPGTPKREVSTIQTAIGPVDQIQYRVGNFNRQYAMAYADFPSFITSVPAQGLLDGARDGALKNTNARLIDDRARHLGEFLGKEIRAELPNTDIQMRAFIFLVKHRLYQIIVVEPKNGIGSARTDSIFFSFELRKDPL
ncbi:MAG: hypothetical protein QME74_05100 [Candidatus Edwardsbacteria bacterium]|nr:hypothetical protein [Candidatus Edwardsbacteria bacterium]